MLEIDHLCFSYGQRLILNELSMFVSSGEIVALVGGSGSGKTTLFQIIAGLRDADCGTIVLNESVSYMMQEDLLLAWRTVMGNLLLAPEIERMEREKKRAMQLLQDVGLEGYEGYYPDQLSGGMRQRVALARALMFNRTFLLLDEPFGAIDLPKRRELYVLLRSLRRKYNLTILFISHHQEDAEELADRIYFLENGKVCDKQHAYSMA